MGKQQTFAGLAWKGKGKVTRREQFLGEMNVIIPWARLLKVIEPHYPKAGKGRQPLGLEKMLRIYFLQIWFDLSDPAAEDAIYDSESMRRFAGIELSDDTIPDETTILRFRQLLEKHGLTEGIFEAIKDLLENKGLLLRSGTIVDATIIAAPSSTKNGSKSRDPEMKQTKKGNAWHFGMKIHVGTDKRGVVHTLTATNAAAADITQMNELLHGEEREVFGDQAYWKEADRQRFRAAGVRYRVNRRGTHQRPLTDYQKKINRGHWGQTRIPHSIIRNEPHHATLRGTIASPHPKRVRSSSRASLRLMTRPLRLEYPGALWHVYNRGVEQRDIFLDDGDRQLFVDLLIGAIDEYAWLLQAWVEMTNHFHLLIETPRTTLSRGMQALESDYAARFNDRHGRVGHLFQGRFGGELVEDATYLLTVSRYVVLNPVDAKMVAQPAEWRWSSYRATAGLTVRPSWLQTEKILGHFHPNDSHEAARRYREFIAAGIGGVANPFENVVAGVYLGSEAFIERVAELTGKCQWTANHSKAQRIGVAPSLESIRSIIEAEYGVSVGVKTWRSKRARAVFALVARRVRSAPWPAIGRHLGMSETGVRRLALDAAKVERQDRRLREEIERMMTRISECGMRV